MRILATGTTGMLGPHVLANLAPHVEKLYVLVRAESLARARELFSAWPNVVGLEGDLSHPDLFADSKAAKEVQGSIDAILHMAARYELAAPHAECFLHNVVGTQNMLYFASSCSKAVHFHYVSTVAVAGDFDGEMPEGEVDLGQKFANHYAKTKYEAEMVVRHWRANGPKSIYRLGIVVGDSKKGAVGKVDGPYYFLKALARARAHATLLNTLKYLPMPFDRKATLPLVPVDVAGKFIAEATLKPSHTKGTRCYHVVSDQPPLVSKFLQDAFDAYGLKVHVVPLPDTRVNDLLLEKIGLPKELLDYLYSGARFPTVNVGLDFPNLSLESYDTFKRAFFEGSLAEFKTEGKGTKTKKRARGSKA